MNSINKISLNAFSNKVIKKLLDMCFKFKSKYIMNLNSNLNVVILNFIFLFYARISTCYINEKVIRHSFIKKPMIVVN